MAGVLNNTARPITLNCKIKKTGRTIKHRLNPTDFKSIPDGEWNLLKKMKVVKGYLEKGDLVVGRQKPIEVPDDFEPDKDSQIINDCRIAATELLDIGGQVELNKILDGFGCENIDDIDDLKSDDAEACIEAISDEIKKSEND